MYLKAFAKINIYLDVISNRDDGYHNLDMIMLPLELHDSISFNILPYSTDSYITCDHIDIQETKYNLINIAINKARDVYHFKEHFAISVHKEIPIRAGLGGGSSNAAAILRALYDVLKIKDNNDNKNALAKSIGADVPFCMLNKPMRVQGIGEALSPIKLHHPYYVLIIMPEKGLSTKHVFEEADKVILKHSNPEKLIKALAVGDDDTVAKEMFNSLEEVSISLVPEIQKIKEMLFNDGLKMVLMSGSGSAVFALSTDHHKIMKLAKKYDKLNYDVYLTRTLTKNE